MLAGVERGISQSCYGTLDNGAAVDSFTLVNRRGTSARLLTLGATLAELHVRDRAGTTADVTLGFDTLEGWLQPDNPYMGCIVGRYANRIAKGRFTLEGRHHQLAINNGTCSLHGGIRGFNQHLWQANPRSDEDGLSVEFRMASPDGEEGYPGTLNVRVIYTLTEADELRLDYRAETDRPTVLNLTNHAYWNLGATRDIHDHIAQIHASRITQTGPESIPTGEFTEVANTPFDLTAPVRLGDRISETGMDPAGYDNNFIIDGWGDGQLKPAARVEDPGSGRVLEVFTTEPGVQFYTANYLDGSLKGKAGQAYAQHSGFCLEAQHFPDSPNHPHFPSTVLRPGAVYQQTTLHRFSVVS